MGKIKNIPLIERPREKAKRYGINSLSNQELFAVIIGSGTKGQSALEIANNLIDKSNGLLNIMQMSFEDLILVKGINNVKAIQILAILEILKRLNHLEIEKKQSVTCSEDIYHMYRFKYQHYMQEELIVLFLNNANHIVHEEIIGMGGFNYVSIDYRVIISKLLKRNCSKCIIVHNHPHSSSKPSIEDIDVTSNLKQKLSFFSIKMLDHIIIGENDYYSFKDNDNL